MGGPGSGRKKGSVSKKGKPLSAKQKSAKLDKEYLKTHKIDHDKFGTPGYKPKKK
jgi:hypothetical protein